MNARKIKRLCHEKPYLFDSAFLLSHSEAEKLVAKYGYPDLSRVIALAQSKGILGEDACNEIDRLVEKYEKRTGFAIWLRRHKRLAIIALVVLLLAGFFGLTPTGRAIAEDIRRVIVSLFEDGFSVEVKPEKNASAAYDIIEHDVTEYSSIEEFEVATGLQAAYVDNDMFDLISVKLYDSKSEIILSTIYETSDKGTVEMQQTWYDDSTYYIGDKHETENWDHYISTFNIRFDYFINDVESHFFAITAMPDSTVYVTGENLQYAILFLDNLQVPHN